MNSEQPRQWDEMRKVYVYRWRLETSAGSKVTWAATKDEARAKAESKGWRVNSIRPAGSPLTDR